MCVGGTRAQAILRFPLILVTLKAHRGVDLTTATSAIQDRYAKCNWNFVLAALNGVQNVLDRFKVDTLHHPIKLERAERASLSRRKSIFNWPYNRIMVSSTNNVLLWQKAKINGQPVLRQPPVCLEQRVHALV
jgi:hypothetical protein